MKDNSNATNEDGWRFFYKIVVPLADNPSASNKNGDTPIYWQEIALFLAPLRIITHNAPDKLSRTPNL